MNSEIEDINKRQKEFYETKNKNLATTLWSFLRNGVLNTTRKKIGIEKDILDLHTSWLGDLSNKKVLDLGCYEGNSLSMYLAKNSRRYVAIDLSNIGIAKLTKRLSAIPTATAITTDFLSSDFTESNFDLIYAYGVLHHFRDTQEIILRLNQKLVDGGEIISYDPLETSLPIKVVRSIYRPFQSDKDWEWPFSRSTYFQYSEAFKVKDRRAVLGKAKWLFLLNFLPFGSQKKYVIAKRWHREDWNKTAFSDSHMFSCMHLTMLLKKEE